MNNFDLIVAGAGPAGSTAAITASDRGSRVLLLEAGPYPRHKVCGEFVSAESAELLRYLLSDRATSLLATPRINTAILHADGRSCEIRLASPGYAIPRFALDDALWRCAQSRKVECRIERVTEVVRQQQQFLVKAGSAVHRAKMVINASGRWSRLSRRVSRGQPLIGLKAHFAGETNDAVDLYFVEGGYCGVQAVAPGVLNVCALVRQGGAKDLTAVFAGDRKLSGRARGWRPITEVFATAPVYLGADSPVVEGVLQVGDAAGFLDPFVGDGISLALRSGVLAGRCVGEAKAEAYAGLYRRLFGTIFGTTRRIRSLESFPSFLHPLIMRGLGIPAVGRKLFHQTRQAGFDVLAEPLDASSNS
jgi:flavin-dependent dehydrogenase